MDNYSDLSLDPFENAFSEKKVRMGFIRKVYGILMVQLAITVGFICLFLYEPSVKMYSYHHPEMFWAAFGLTFVMMIVLACCGNVRRTFPVNFICLFIFTFLESFLLGSAASYYNQEAVMYAVAICSVVCLGLTLFAFQTKWDFTMCGGMLMVSLLILICFGFICIFIPGNKVVSIVYSAFGALVFSMFLVYDTQLIIGGKHAYSIHPEEYIFAALNLYLDVINLFLYILRFTGGGRS